MSNNFPAIRKQLTEPAVVKMVEARIGAKAGTFITSVLDLIGAENSLQKCDPNLVMKEALKAAGLDLPISKSLGFAYVVPYSNVPSFQMGAKGYVQLAIRTGQYKYLNAGIIYEGELYEEDRMRGTIKITGKKKSLKALGYFSYMELLNGFEKAIVWTADEVVAHAKKFSKSYKKKDSPWQTNFDSMAKKTMILQLIPKYGPMSVDIVNALESDRGDFAGFGGENKTETEIEENANQGEVVDITDYSSDEMTEEEKKEVVAQEMTESDVGPGF